MLAIGYGEPWWSFVVAGAITGLAGLALDQITEDNAGASVTPRESFLVVALLWLLIPIFGALPYILDGGPQLSRPVDAYFEAVSGFTATGATLVPRIEELARSMLFWRQLSHWLGGMGIIVLAVAILPRLRIGGRQLLQSELAGPTEIEKLGQTIRETARRLWRLYVILTLIAIFTLGFLGWSGLDDQMTFFDAVGQALSVVALGGFSTRTISIAAFAPVTQYVILFFMIVAGINFLRLYRFLVQRRFDVLARDEELRLYLVLIALGSTLVGVEVIGGGYETRRGGRAPLALPGDGDPDHHGVRDRRLRRLGPDRHRDLAAADVLRRVGRVDGRRHQDRPAPVAVQARQARARADRAPRGDRADPGQRAGGGREGPALADRLRAALPARVRRRVTGLVIDSGRAGEGLTAFEAFGAAAACLGNVGPAFGFAGPYGSFEPFSDLSTLSARC